MTLQTSRITRNVRFEEIEFEPDAYDPQNSIIPDLVIGYESTSTSRHVLHEVFGSPYPAVSLREVSSRSGTLQLFFLNEETSSLAEQFIRQPGVYYLQGDTMTMDMAFVPSGQITRMLDSETLTRWILKVDYREVAAP